MLLLYHAVIKQLCNVIMLNLSHDLRIEFTLPMDLVTGCTYVTYAKMVQHSQKSLAQGLTQIR
jgi:hypothetical protein